MKSGARVLTVSEREEGQQLREAGLSYSELANHFCCSKPYMWKLFHGVVLSSTAKERLRMRLKVKSLPKNVVEQIRSLYSNTKFPMVKIAQICGVDRTTVGRYVNDLPHRSYCRCVTHSTSIYDGKVIIPNLISPELARIIGHLQGDGSVGKTANKIFYGSQPFLNDQFADDFETVFGVRPHKSYRITNGKKYPCVEITCKRIAEFLRSTAIFGSRTYEVPKIIFDSSQNIQVEYLRALFDDDGSFFVSKRNQGSLELCSVSSKALEGITQLLETMNIPCFHWKKYVISIRKSCYIERFARTINFSLPEKMEKLELWLKNIKRWTYPSELHTVAHDLRSKGLTYANIATELGVKDPETVRKWFDIDNFSPLEAVWEGEI